jgi:hypothetical protein
MDTHTTTHPSAYCCVHVWRLSYVGGQTIDLKHVQKRNSRAPVVVAFVPRRRGASLDETLAPKRRSSAVRRTHVASREVVVIGRMR